VATCVATTLFLGAAAAQAAGGLGGDVKNFFNSINYNTTAPGVYQGQQAGYYTGGGIFARAPVRSYNLLNIQLPQFRAGCGGIDLFSGGFSFINAKQFTGMLRNIGQNATGLAFMLALQLVSPQIKGVLSDVYSWAQKINNMQINSCNAAEQLLGGGLSLLGASEQSCVMQRMANDGEDYNTADVNCRANPNDTGATAGSTAPAITQGNIAWRALMYVSLFRDDLQLSMAVMNLTGTVLVTNPGGSNPQPTIQIIPSQLATTGASTGSGTLLDAILHGGTAAIRYCSDASADTSACTQISNGTENVTIPQSEALVPFVENTLNDIVAKIENDTPLTQADINLLNSTSLPVYKYLTVSTAYLPATSAGNEAHEYAELIAKDLLYGYLMDILGKVQTGASALSTRGGIQQQLQTFNDQITAARTAVRQEDARTTRDYDMALRLTSQTRLYESILVGSLSPRMQESAFFQASN
jgi:Conjugative relaxosome accessory transposon protein.